MEFTYLDGRVSISGGCVAAVIVRTIYGWVNFRQCA